MTPGSIEFRNHILKTVPQEGGEPRAQYLQRAARHFKFSTQRLHDLFYDPRTELSVDEHEVLFAVSAPNPKLARLKEAEMRNEYINQIIQDNADEIANMALRKFAESILETLPRSSG